MTTCPDRAQPCPMGLRTCAGGFVILILAAALLSASRAIAEAPSGRLQIHTNESYIEEVTRRVSLPLSDTKAMFALVLESLPDRAKIYPTENYYYFRFHHNGVPYGGNIRLDVTTRDQGKLHFAFYEELTGWDEEKETVRYAILDQNDGVTVTKLERFLYRVSLGQKSVVFELNDLSQVVPPAAALASGEWFIGPIFDESAIRFFLIYNPKLKIFHYVLDETAGVADELAPVERTDRILIGKRTGFAFYRDHRLDRKILIGVFDTNSRLNNYFDGPFDQLPDNFIAGEELRQAILEVEPHLTGKIDRLGGLSGGASRYLIGPYAYYRSEDDLYPFHRCATSKRVPREMYHACFVTADSGAPAEPLPLRKKAPQATPRKTK